MPFKEKLNPVHYTLFVLRLALTAGLLILSACAQNQAPLPSAVQNSDKAFIGITYRLESDMDQLAGTNARNGLRVTRVLAGTPADQAGLQTGDVIVGYDGHDFGGSDAALNLRRFIDYLRDKSPGDTLDLILVRKRTLLQGTRNDQSLDLQEIGEIYDLLENRHPGDRLALEIEDQVKIVRAVVHLSNKPGSLEQLLPENSTLYPELEKTASTAHRAILALMEEHQLFAVYQDLLKRYDEDEAWDDGLRLKPVRYVRRDPLRLTQVAQAVTENIFTPNDLPGVLEAMSVLSEEPREKSAPLAAPFSSDITVHMTYIRAVLAAALAERNSAMQGITRADYDFWRSKAPLSADSFLSDDVSAEGLQTNQRLVDIGLKINHLALLRATDLLARLADPVWLKSLAGAAHRLAGSPMAREPAANDEILYSEQTPAGLLLIGGTGNNHYTREDAALIFDLGGDDIYLNRAGGADWEMPLALVVDFSGDDQYSANRDAAQGSGLFGIGILADLAGDDVYLAGRFSQGTGVAGAGILVDASGSDRYYGREYTQGAGMWGLGLLWDRSGHDHYKADLYAQGYGGPKSIGLLLDEAGDDFYFAGGHHPSSYGTANIFNGFSQGFGAGLRGYASGGIGMLLDGEGADHFQAGNFSQGGGFFYGLGIIYNAGAQADRYSGSRYAQGFAAHSAAGILIDEGGDDVYSGHKGALQAAAWDLSVAVLWDKSGNDRYQCRHLFFCQAAAAHNGFALLLDESGQDDYSFPEEPKIGGNDYHGGESLSLSLDFGGDEDRYNGESAGNSSVQKTGCALKVDADKSEEFPEAR